MNIINWTDKAIRQLRKIKDTDMQKRIYKETQVLQDFPKCASVKHLNNHKCPYRLRIGDYRIFFDFDGVIKLISIKEVKKRDEHTY